jgi:hypothetical protein
VDETNVEMVTLGEVALDKLFMSDPGPPPFLLAVTASPNPGPKIGKSAKNKLKASKRVIACAYRDGRAGSGAGLESLLKRSMISASRGSSRSCASNSSQVIGMAGSEVSFS